MAILDFEIQRSAENQYELSVYDRETSHLLLTSHFELDAGPMTTLEMGYGEADPRTSGERYNALEERGQMLYNALFTTEVQGLWSDSLEKSSFLVLCIRIADNALELNAFPWEALHDGNEFMFVSSRAGISRLPLSTPPVSDFEPLTAPLHMLAVISSPLDLENTEQFDIEQEHMALLRAVHGPNSAGALKLTIEDEASLPVITAAIEEHPHIFHYTGRASVDQHEGLLLLEDSMGHKQRTPVSELSRIFARNTDSLRLAVIAGCEAARSSLDASFQHTAASLFESGIPNVIGMHYSITDEARRIFVDSFYPLLASNHSVEEALSLTRMKLFESQDDHVCVDAFAPVLLSANGRCLIIDHQAPPARQEFTDEANLSLPPLPSSFYGRRRSYRMLHHAFSLGNQRAVILHGREGSGTTTLARYAADRLTDRFYGVYAFDCSAGTLTSQMILLLLSRYYEARGIDRLSTLVQASLTSIEKARHASAVLSEYPLLLIFDGFESLLERTQDNYQIQNEDLERFLETLLEPDSGATRLVFTSRHRFAFPESLSEQVLEIPLHDLSRPEALGMMQALPYLKTENFADLEKIYDAFGGHPHSLAVVDGYVRHHSIQEVQSDLSTITTGHREFKALEITYVRLSDTARDLLNRLSVFRRPVPVSATDWVIKDDRTNEYLDELIDWGLVVRYSNEEASYISLHPLIRSYCRSVHNPVQWKVWLWDAISFYTHKTERSDQESLTIDLLQKDLEAFDLCLEAQDWKTAAHIAGRSTLPLLQWGLFEESKRLYDSIPEELLTSEQQAVRLHNLGVIRQKQREDTEALDHFLQSIEIHENLGDRYQVALGHYEAARIYHKQKEYEQALTHFENALDLMQYPDHAQSIADALDSMAILFRETGNYENASQHVERALELQHELENEDGIASALQNRGALHELRGNYLKSLQDYTEALQIYEKKEHKVGLVGVHRQIGILSQRLHEPEKALEHFRGALRLAEDLEDQATMATALHHIGRVYQSLKDADNALSFFWQSLAIDDKLRDMPGLAATHHQVGLVYQSLEQYDQALQHYEDSLGIAESINDRAGMARSLHHIGWLHALQGDFQTALTFFNKSLAIHEEAGDLDKLASTHRKIGEILEEGGRLNKALSHFASEAELLKEQHAPALYAGALESMARVAYKSKDIHTAISLCRQAFLVYSNHGLHNEQANTKQQIGILYHTLGEFTEAMTAFSEAHALYDEVEDLNGQAAALHQMGVLHQRTGKYDQAMTQFRESLRLNLEMNYTSGIARTLHHIGQILQTTGNYKEAHTTFRKCLHLHEELNDTEGLASSSFQLGLIEQTLNNVEAALTLFNQSLTLYEGLGNQKGLAAALHHIGRVYEEQENYVEALEHYQKALEIKQEAGSRSSYATTLQQIGCIHQYREEYEQALQLFQEVLAIQKEVGYKLGIASINAQIGKLQREQKVYRESFNHLIVALAMFTEMHSPLNEYAMKELIWLRDDWGGQHFDPRWEAATQSTVPSWFVE